MKNKQQNIIIPKFKYNTCVFCSSILGCVVNYDNYYLFCKNCLMVRDTTFYHSSFNLYYNKNQQLYEFFINFDNYYALNFSGKLKIIIIRDNDYSYIRSIKNITFEYKHDKDYLLDKLKTIMVFS